MAYFSNYPILDFTNWEHCRCLRLWLRYHQSVTFFCQWQKTHFRRVVSSLSILNLRVFGLAAQEDNAHFLLTADFVLYLLSGNKIQFDVNPKAASCFADGAIVWFYGDLSSVTMGNLHFTHALVNKLHHSLTLLADFPVKIDQNREIQDINVNLLCGNCR